MIQLVFSTVSRKLIRFTIDKRIVRYFDDNWKNGIQILPSQTPEMRLMLRKMMVHRKQTIQAMAQLIIDSNSGKNKEDYDNCKSDEDIADMIRKEALTKGLMEVV